MTTLSLSEVDALALKAARGAGLDWGLAEEAAFAARWLVEQGLDGLTLLALHLDHVAAMGAPKAALRMVAEEWSSATPAALCPIMTGAALSDHFDLPDGPGHRGARLINLACPALVLPFLAKAAARSGVVLTVDWAQTRVMLADGVLLALAGAEGLMADEAPVVTLGSMPRRPLSNDHGSRAELSDLAGRVLDRLVYRTYVPASEQSRRDAGGMGPDNH